MTTLTCLVTEVWPLTGRVWVRSLNTDYPPRYFAFSTPDWVRACGCPPVLGDRVAIEYGDDEHKLLGLEL